jgi:hypothetical protein
MVGLRKNKRRKELEGAFDITSYKCSNTTRPARGSERGK